MKLVIQDKIESYLEWKYRISRSFATQDFYRFVEFRFVDFIQVQYKQDFSGLGEISAGIELNGVIFSGVGFSSANGTIKNI